VIVRSQRTIATIRSSSLFFSIDLRSLVLGVLAMIASAAMAAAAPAAFDGGGFANDPELVVTQRVVLRGLAFGFDTAYIQPVSAGTLEAVAGGLELRPDVLVVIEGYTDSIGSEAYNQDLSQRRAESVKLILIGYGIDPERLEAVGLGEANPIASDDTMRGRTLNRRVELVLYEKRLNP
jgi:outer membrane protein OmpA-like peptidoglycan-associated protein